MSVSRMQQRRDTSTRWAAVNPVLLDGELGYDTTVDRYKVGDGVQAWTALPWSDRLEEMQAVRTTAQLTAATNSINTTGKVAGRWCFNTTTSKPVWATGTTATAPWVDATGTTAHTPS